MGKFIGAIIALVFLGACVATAVPLANPVRETPQGLHVAPDLLVNGGAPSLDGEKAGAEVWGDPPGEPLRGLKETVEPKIRAEPFTRRIERARIEARGARRNKAGSDAAALQAAVAFDNEAWIGEPRRELLAYLRRDVVDRNAEFTRADARTVAQLQAGSGAVADGVLRDETIAVLFAMGFRFSARKAMAWEVRVEFYPGELEDLDAWNRAIDEKVTKNGGDFRDVNAPEGEGSLYVHVGRSIVASYRARGGPPSRLDDGGEHVAVPTKPGVYRLGPAHTHVTRNWYYSQIPWGADIRKNDGGYQYRWPERSGWSWATSHPGGTLTEPITADDFEGLPEVTRDGVTFLIWNKNDFGPMAWNLAPSDMYVHTTADMEPDATTGLPVSHGCIHIVPRERDEMIQRGYLGTGTPFVVRRWDEHLLPDQVRHDLLNRTGVASKS